MPNLETCKTYSERIAIFSGLTPEEVRDILKMGEVLEFQSGKTVFHEGTQGTKLFIVLKGEVSIYRRATEIAVLKRGDAFGEIAVLNKIPRTATASAKTMVRLFTLTESQVGDILKSPSGIRVLLNVINILSIRLTEANAKLADAK